METATTRRLFIAGALGSGLSLAQAQSPVRLPPSEPLPIEIVGLIDQLPGRVVLGNPNGSAHLVEFFDYNCPFCRNSARDLRPLLKADPEIRYTLVNFAVLGVASIEATRVALAFTQKHAERYLDFHEALFATRGRVAAEAALAVAGKFGADREALLDAADSDSVTEAMVTAVKLGDTLGLRATPSYVAGSESLQGYVSLPGKALLAQNLQRCEKPRC